MPQGLQASGLSTNLHVTSKRVHIFSVKLGRHIKGPTLWAVSHQGGCENTWHSASSAFEPNPEPLYPRISGCIKRNKGKVLAIGQGLCIRKKIKGGGSLKQKTVCAVHLHSSLSIRHCVLDLGSLTLPYGRDRGDSKQTGGGAKRRRRGGVNVKGTPSTGDVNGRRERKLDERAQPALHLVQANPQPHPRLLGALGPRVPPGPRSPPRTLDRGSPGGRGTPGERGPRIPPRAAPPRPPRSPGRGTPGGRGPRVPPGAAAGPGQGDTWRAGTARAGILPG